MINRERWHNRIISEIESRLQFLRNRATIVVNKGSRAGPDIQLITKRKLKR